MTAIVSMWTLPRTANKMTNVAQTLMPTWEPNMGPDNDGEVACWVNTINLKGVATFFETIAMECVVSHVPMKTFKRAARIVKRRRNQSCGRCVASWDETLKNHGQPCCRSVVKFENNGCDMNEQNICGFYTLEVCGSTHVRGWLKGGVKGKPSLSKKAKSKIDGAPPDVQRWNCVCSRVAIESRRTLLPLLTVGCPLKPSRFQKAEDSVAKMIEAMQEAITDRVYEIIESDFEAKVLNGQKLTRVFVEKVVDDECFRVVKMLDEELGRDDIDDEAGSMSSSVDEEAEDQ